MSNRPTMLLSKVRDWVRTKEGGWIAASYVVHLEVVLGAESKWAVRVTDINGATHLLDQSFDSQEDALTFLDGIVGIPKDQPA